MEAKARQQVDSGYWTRWTGIQADGLLVPIEEWGVLVGHPLPILVHY